MEKGKNIKNTYPVLGMSCASCAARVDKTLGSYIPPDPKPGGYNLCL